MMYAVEMPSYGMKFLPSFMKTGRGVQGTLGFSLSNFNVCNVGIIHRKEL
jgi:hypothetical protein